VRFRKRLSVWSGRFSEEEMDRSIGSERAWPSVRSEPLSQGEALILILLLSFGFWAAIWGVIALLAVGGR